MSTKTFCDVCGTEICGGPHVLSAQLSGDKGCTIRVETGRTDLCRSCMFDAIAKVDKRPHEYARPQIPMRGAILNRLGKRAVVTEVVELPIPPWEICRTEVRVILQYE